MAKFEGSIKEFYNYIGPRIRNTIQVKTKRLRNLRNKICEDCGQERELESAHIHTNNRRSIIERVLKSYTKNEVIVCDLKKVEEEIIAEHDPLEKNFRFLCKPCHKSYDNLHSVKVSVKPTAKKTSSIRKSKPKEGSKLNRIEKWAKKPEQINSRMISVYLKITKEKGSVSLEDFKLRCRKVNITPQQFKSNYNSMKTDAANSHGRVFHEENGEVLMYLKAKQEVSKYWPV